jgi:FlaA1/EpsC-like NDP-sugar epimerase
MKKSLSRLAIPVLALPRPAKLFLILSVDLGLCILAVWLAYYLRLGKFVSLSGNSLLAIALSIGIALPIFIASGLYRAIFRYSGWPALLAVARAMSIYGLLYASIFTAVGIAGVPRTVGIIQPILLFLFVGASRALARLWLGNEYQSILKHAARPKVLIYGAGRTGRQLATVLKNSYEMKVVGFLDDDDRLHEHMLDGLPIHDPNDLAHLASLLTINAVLLAMPGMNRKRRNEILSRLQRAHVSIRTLPSLADLTQGKVSVSDLRELDIDDFLGREAVTPNHILLSKSVLGKIVLVTGAGGAIGSEICRQILSIGPAKLLLIEQNEFALHAIHQELQEKLGEHEITLVPLLASVQDEERMREIMSTWRPDTVYHAAAYKHVTLVEHNPAEGIKNNVFGTLRTAQAAAESGVSNFVLVSIDKALHPTNIMEASKRLAEMALQALADIGPGTKFSIVRFGQVAGPSGSVVTRLRQQIRDGGPVTLAHPEMTSLFMTTPEAAQLVIQSGAIARGGDIFVLDMGQPVKIMDLARRMIELSGLTVRDDAHPDGDIEIRITGLRPAEKLSEELLIGNHPEPALHPKLIKVQDDYIPWNDIEGKLNALDVALDLNDVSVVRRMMQQLVTSYTPRDDIVDWVYLEQVTEA